MELDFKFMGWELDCKCMEMILAKIYYKEGNSYTVSYGSKVFTNGIIQKLFEI